MQQLREVQGLAAGGLLDLLAAAETIGHDQCVRRRCADFRQHALLGDGERNVVFLRLKPEGTGHAAATGIQHFAIERQLVQQLAFRVLVQHGMMMTMELDQCLGRRLRHRRRDSAVHKKFAEEARLFRQCRREWVVREQRGQFVTKGGGAGWLQSDDG